MDEIKFSTEGLKQDLSQFEQERQDYYKLLKRIKRDPILGPNFLSSKDVYYNLNDEVFWIDQKPVEWKEYKEENTSPEWGDEDNDDEIKTFDMLELDLENNKTATCVTTKRYDYYGKDGKHYVLTRTRAERLEIVEDAKSLIGEPLVYKISPKDLAMQWSLKEETFTIWGKKVYERGKEIEEIRNDYWKIDKRLREENRQNIKQMKLREGIFRDTKQFINNDKFTLKDFLDLTQDYSITSNDFQDATRKYEFKGLTEGW